jgi:hypothetical protein
LKVLKARGQISALPKAKLVLWVCAYCGGKYHPGPIVAAGRCTCGSTEGELVEFEAGEENA